MPRKIKVVPVAEFERLSLIIRRYDEKLKELMPEKDYLEWSVAVAKESFFMECTKLPDGEFKEFVLDNFKKIVGDENNGMDTDN